MERGAALQFRAGNLNAALRCLARHPEWLNTPHGDWILTPHVGEFSALCGRSVEEIQADRIRCAEEYALAHQVTLVLKGADTLIVSSEGLRCVNKTGNPSLAKAGSGDLLTGMPSPAPRCPRLDTDGRACCGVWLHGKAADKAIEKTSLYGVHHKGNSGWSGRFLIRSSEGVMAVMEIRPVTRADFTGDPRLVSPQHPGSRHPGLHPSQCAAWTAGADKPGWAERFLATWTIGAFCEDQLAGFCESGKSDSAGLFHVHPDFQRQGVGTALLNAIVAQARSQGRGLPAK